MIVSQMMEAERMPLIQQVSSLAAEAKDRGASEITLPFDLISKRERFETNHAGPDVSDRSLDSHQSDPLRAVDDD